MSAYDPAVHHRRSIRLSGYDYSRQGMYFITICAQDRACLFGEIADGIMHLSNVGMMVQATWDEIPQHYPDVEFDAFVVMPNHVHGIVAIMGNDYPAGRSLADVASAFKSLTTRRYADGVRNLDWPPFRGRLWQRNYYEHIIRDDGSLDRIRQYILDNPNRWEEDQLHPDRPSKW